MLYEVITSSSQSSQSSLSYPSSVSSRSFTYSDWEFSFDSAYSPDYSPVKQLSGTLGSLPLQASESEIIHLGSSPYIHTENRLTTTDSTPTVSSIEIITLDSTPTSREIITIDTTPTSSRRVSSPEASLHQLKYSE